MPSRSQWGRKGREHSPRPLGPGSERARSLLRIVQDFAAYLLPFSLFYGKKLGLTRTFYLGYANS